MLHQRRLTITRRAALLAAGMLPAASSARAQSAFPSRPVRIIVPATPGGAIDITARLLAERLPSVWNQPVVVENRASANNIIGTEAIARSTPGANRSIKPSFGSLKGEWYFATLSRAHF
jgi:tripartite-type tricarboxylate transporter receptor subunit TctC